MFLLFPTSCILHYTRHEIYIGFQGSQVTYYAVTAARPSGSFCYFFPMKYLAFRSTRYVWVDNQKHELNYKLNERGLQFRKIAIMRWSMEIFSLIHRGRNARLKRRNNIPCVVCWYGMHSIFTAFMAKLAPNVYYF